MKNTNFYVKRAFMTNCSQTVITPRVIKASPVFREFDPTRIRSSTTPTPTAMPFIASPPSRFPKRANRAAPLIASVLVLLVFALLPRSIPTIPAIPSPPERSSYYTRASKPLPQCSTRGRAKSFLIVFQSRSGSTAISTHLKSHSAVHMTMLEYLDRLGVAMSNNTGALAETRAFFRDGIRRGLVPGFKIRSYHILGDVEKWAALVKEFDTRIIWQYRKNVVKSAIGTYQTEVLGDSTAISGIKKDQIAQDRCSMGVGCKFRITDMERFHDMLKKRVHYQDMISHAVNVLDAGRKCTLEVPYEDYLYFPRQTVSQLLRFLGLEEQRTDTDRVKATADSLCDVVENFDELCRSFYGCAGWQPYFDDFVNNCRCTNFSSGSVDYCQVNV